MIKKFKIASTKKFISNLTNQDGKIGYVIMWLLGTPISLLIILWLFLGNNIFSKG